MVPSVTVETRIPERPSWRYSIGSQPPSDHSARLDATVGASGTRKLGLAIGDDEEGLDNGHSAHFRGTRSTAIPFVSNRCRADPTRGAEIIARGTPLVSRSIVAVLLIETERLQVGPGQSRAAHHSHRLVPASTITRPG